MKKSTQEYLIRQLESRIAMVCTRSATESITSMIAELKAIECEPECAAQFDEAVLVSGGDNDFVLRHFNGMDGKLFKCFPGGHSSKETDHTTTWPFMKRCLVFEPYEGVKPELKGDEIIMVRNEKDYPTSFSFHAYGRVIWDNVVDYCIYKLPKS